MIKLTELRRLEAHAMPDPWPEGGTWVKDMLNRCSEAEARQACAFLAHTRNALPLLLDVVEAADSHVAANEETYLPAFQVHDEDIPQRIERINAERAQTYAALEMVVLRLRRAQQLQEAGDDDVDEDWSCADTGKDG